MDKIVKNDQVIVIAGKDKGKIGKVLKVSRGRVVVDGVNLAKKHRKPNPVRGVEGGLVEINMPIDISNIAIFNPETRKPDRVKIVAINTEGGVEKKRVFKSNNLEVR